MGFEILFRKEFYFRDYNENTDEFIPQKKILKLLRDKIIINIFRNKGIELPDISEPTFRKKVKELVDKNKIRSKHMRNMVLVNINDIFIVINYLIDKMDSSNKTKFARTKTADRSSVNSIIKEIEKIRKQESNEEKKVEKLLEDAKNGDNCSAHILKEKFLCKVYTKDELKEYEKKLNKKGRK